jgi:uncharacterized protein
MASRTVPQAMDRASFVMVSRPIPAGVGIGLRLPHHQWVLQHAPAAPWLEVHPENYMHSETAAAELDLIRKKYPLSLHSVGLSLGSAEGVCAEHVRRLARLIGRYEPALVSDHLSWSAIDGVHFPDLLPLPYTEEALEVVARNIDAVQRQIRRRILVENPSSYLRFSASTLSEAEFIGELVRRCGCGVLLDINNIAVSAYNHGESPAESLVSFLRHVPPASIAEIHLAGHATLTLEKDVSLRVDDHGSRVSGEVWQLYAQAVAALGMRPTLIEWDKNLPDFDTLRQEADMASEVSRRALDCGGENATVN